MFARSFWSACSLNFEDKSLYFELMFVTLFRTNVAKIWDFILFSHVFGTNTHLVKVPLLIDARRTIEDEIRNALHLMQDVLYGNKLVVDMKNDDTFFHLIWCSIGTKLNESKVAIFLDMICTLFLTKMVENTPCNMVVHILECDAWLIDLLANLNEDECTKILDLLCICFITYMAVNNFMSTIHTNDFSLNVPVWNPTLAAFCNGLIIFILIVDGALRNHRVVFLW